MAAELIDNNVYQGTDGMGWHADDENELEQNSAIASVSLGSERKFVFKHRLYQDRISIVLEHGSLLVMKGSTQSHWLHALPSTKRVNNSRINLTFRRIIDNSP